MTSKEALLDIKKRNEALKKEEHFHIGETTMNIIEQLVERDTPKKPKESNLYGDIKHTCSVCNSILTIPVLKEINFCPKCGQRIDWSKE